MLILKRRVGLPGKEFDAVPITPEEVKVALELGTIKQISKEVFEQCDVGEYQTKVMTPGKTRGRPKGSKNKKKVGRPRKTAKK